MQRTEVRDVNSTDLAKYEFLVDRIRGLEAEQVEARLRPEESKLKGLHQTLASYEDTLHELHRVHEHRHMLTHKAEGSFDLLGRKHKQRKVDEQRQKEEQACRAEVAQRERVDKVRTKLERQRLLVQDLRHKTRELDAVRQAEMDFVDRLFRSDGIIVDSQHDALEEAVCALAPRQFKMREALATRAVAQAKLESARHQVRAAAEELEHAFEPAHRMLRDEFGDDLGEEFFDSADVGTKLKAASTADKLLKAAVQNMARARHRIAVLPGLSRQEARSLACCVEPVLAAGAGVDSVEMRRLVRDCINALYVAESQTQYAAQTVADEGAKIQSELGSMEGVLNTSKSQLDGRRRTLLSQVQQAKRSNSLRISDSGSYSGTLTAGDVDFRNRWARRSTNGMGDKVPSVNSGLARLA